MDAKGAWMAVVGRGGAFNELALHDAVTGERKWRRTLAGKATAATAVASRQPRRPPGRPRKARLNW